MGQVDIGIFGYLFDICGGKMTHYLPTTTCYDVFDMLHNDLKIAKNCKNKSLN